MHKDMFLQYVTVRKAFYLVSGLKELFDMSSDDREQHGTAVRIQEQLAVHNIIHSHHLLLHEAIWRKLVDKLR
jgi:hypothetical protein